MPNVAKKSVLICNTQNHLRSVQQHCKEDRTWRSATREHTFHKQNGRKKCVKMIIKCTMPYYQLLEKILKPQNVFKTQIGCTRIDGTTVPHVCLCQHSRLSQTHAGRAVTLSRKKSENVFFCKRVLFRLQEHFEKRARTF